MLIFRLLFCLTTKAFLSPQLLVYMPIDLPFHYAIYLFGLFQSNKPLVLVCPLACSTYSQIYPFINLPVSFLFFTWLTCTLIVNSSAGLHTDRPTRKLMYPLILMLLSNHEDLPADSNVYMSKDAPVQKLSPFVFMHPLYLFSEVKKSLHSLPSLERLLP